MPLYEFECLECKEVFEVISKYDESGEYQGVICPNCKSNNKRKLVSMIQFNFANPEGTDRWNSDGSGHDYRFRHNLPKVLEQRKNAELASHMGSAPYRAIDDTKYDTGIHDV